MPSEKSQGTTVAPRSANGWLDVPVPAARSSTSSPPPRLDGVDHLAPPPPVLAHREHVVGEVVPTRHRVEHAAYVARLFVEFCTGHGRRLRGLTREGFPGAPGKPVTRFAQRQAQRGNPAAVAQESGSGGTPHEVAEVQPVVERDVVVESVPAGRRPEGPGLLPRSAVRRARSRVATIRADGAVPVVQITGHQGEVLQPMTPEQGLASKVTETSISAPVIRPVVLPHDPGFDVEKIRYAKELARLGEDRAVTERSREAGINHPHQPHPCLGLGPAVLIGEAEYLFDQREAVPPGPRERVVAHPLGSTSAPHGQPRPARPPPRAGPGGASGRTAPAGSPCTGRRPRRGVLSHPDDREEHGSPLAAAIGGPD